MIINKTIYLKRTPTKQKLHLVEFDLLYSETKIAKEKKNAFEF